MEENKREEDIKVEKEGSVIMQSLWMILIILFFFNAISFGLNTLLLDDKLDDLVVKYLIKNIGWMVIAIGMIFILKTKELK